MGTIYADIKLTNRFSGKSVNVRAMVDTGTTYMCIPVRVALELGYDLDEISTFSLTVADSRRVRCPHIDCLRIDFEDRWCTCDAAVLGDECLMGCLSLEAMDLVVNPKLERVTGNPKHPDGPTWRV